MADLEDSESVRRENVFPSGWINPVPQKKYNLVVLGGGTAGLVSAAIAAALGAKVALVEREHMGGDCLNTGCVPSKAILRIARGAGELKRMRDLGMKIPETAGPADFKEAMKRMRRLRAKISRHDSAKRFGEMGVDLFFGAGSFLDRERIAVSGSILRFSKAAICTGAKPVFPDIPGLGPGTALTTDSVFSLPERPESFAVIGAGPAGVELAQAFSRFGSRVTLFELADRILPGEDRKAGEILHEALNREGIEIVTGAKIDRVEELEEGRRICFESGREKKEIFVEKILVCAGRRPDTGGLGLERAGIRYDLKGGIRVDRHLRTSNPRVYAAGDVCFPMQFTHAADATAQILIQNALFPHPFGIGSARADDLIVPRTVYTDPEIAHVGRMDEAELIRAGMTESLFFSLHEVDRAILDGEETGFARIDYLKGSDRIAGATIVAPHAGEMIGEITLAMRAGAGLRIISQTIHPYPTQAEVIKKAAVLWRKQSLTERKKNLLSKWFSFSRS
jgi:pyruvate/2-oxoglutarate dehydrogenase complex dihydrolipoamide dehydrogenase (E3) component